MSNNFFLFVLHLHRDSSSSTFLRFPFLSRRIITGSFDRTVKIWTADGKRIHTVEDPAFHSNVTGLCYINRTRTIWVVAGGTYPLIFDPKSGENVTEFLGNFENEAEDGINKYSLQLIQWFNEPGIVVGSTSRRCLIVWKYNTSGCITTLKTPSEMECLTYSMSIILKF